ncbi:MAG: 2-methylcitrate dehydratase [Betaproteobacteria bacterium]|nr:2-methylcitrate dehydratase [Betaproteobacteria bacterium]
MNDSSLPPKAISTRSSVIAAYAAGALQRKYPATVTRAAITALVDYIGVAVGAVDEAPVGPVRQVAQQWGAQGRARIFLGPLTTPALAALVNATMAHAMDYDDAHQMGAGHISCPCWSAAFAVGNETGATEAEMIAAFIAGFEVMARLGGGGPAGVGRNLHRRGLHPTAILGRIGAAVVASVLMRLDARQIEFALGVAATTAGGLIGSFGTHAKPFHGGKAAMDGILAAQLAANGFESSTRLLELEKGLFDSIIQDRKVEAPPLDFDARWEILRNGFKPYASCRATHASIQAARKLAAQITGRQIKRVRARVHPNAMVASGKLQPRTPLECKFSISFCIALGLRGYRVVATDFTESTFDDRTLHELLPLIEIEVVPDQPQYEAHLDVHLADGSALHADTEIVLGHADNPMSDEDFRGKFEGLVAPVLGMDCTAQLYALVNDFERTGNFGKVMALLERDPRKKAGA